MSNIDELIEQLRRKGLSRASALGYHSGLFDEAADALEKLQAELERVKAERDAAVKDMEALMWFSGEGCHICANEVIIHKEPYVRSECSREKGTDCCPKWRGQKEDRHETPYRQTPRNPAGAVARGYTRGSARAERDSSSVHARLVLSSEPN